jgi:hypothetical protein
MGIDEVSDLIYQGSLGLVIGFAVAGLSWVALAIAEALREK